MEQIINDTSVIVQEITPQEKLKNYLDECGIKYSHIAKRLNHKPSWTTRIFSGVIPLTDDKKQKIEEILPNFKF